MFERRSLRLPITLGVVMIVLVVVLLVGWVILAIAGALADDKRPAFYWTFLTVGASFLVTVLAGVITYLTLSVKAINLNRRQSNFIDSVTHELKSPITSLKLYLQTLNRRAVPESERAHFNEIMLDDVERLDTLINQLLTAARLERGEARDDPTSVRIDEIIGKCVADVCLRHRRPTDIVHLVLEACTLECQAVDLDLALRNLIDNAVKYAGDQPEVWITLSQVGQDAVISIEDNGNGIPPHMRRKVFGRFVRLGVELEREKPGTGLGLYITGTLVRQLKGKIRIKDGRNGNGTLFEMTLPGVQPAQANCETLDLPQPTPS